MRQALSDMTATRTRQLRSTGLRQQDYETNPTRKMPLLSTWKDRCAEFGKTYKNRPGEAQALPVVSRKDGLRDKPPSFVSKKKKLLLMLVIGDIDLFRRAVADVIALRD